LQLDECVEGPRQAQGTERAQARALSTPNSHVQFIVRSFRHAVAPGTDGPMPNAIWPAFLTGRVSQPVALVHIRDCVTALGVSVDVFGTVRYFIIQNLEL
jgi:hypothetical protein